MSEAPSKSSRGAYKAVKKSGRIFDEELSAGFRGSDDMNLQVEEEEEEEEVTDEEAEEEYS